MEARTVDKFRQSFDTVRRRLGDLKPIHKVLLGSGLVIFLMGMFIVAQYAGKSDEALIIVSPENHEAVRTRLASSGIKATADVTAASALIARNVGPEGLERIHAGLIAERELRFPKASFVYAIRY